MMVLLFLKNFFNLPTHQSLNSENLIFWYKVIKYHILSSGFVIITTNPSNWRLQKTYNYNFIFRWSLSKDRSRAVTLFVKKAFWFHRWPKHITSPQVTWPQISPSLADHIISEFSPHFVSQCCKALFKDGSSPPWLCPQNHLWSLKKCLCAQAPPLVWFSRSILNFQLQFI